jgi:hypothetical protein
MIRFNAEGVEGLRDRPKSGRPTWLDEGQLASLRAVVLRGPDPERDGVSTWRAKICAGSSRSVSASPKARTACSGGSTTTACRSRRRGRSIPRPTARPRAASKKFPALIEAIARDHPEAERLEVWFLDEARVGQTGRVCRRWFERGMRPSGVRDLRHQAV